MIRLVLQTNISGQHHLWLLGPQGVIAQRHFHHQHHGADRLLDEIVSLVGRQRLAGILVVRGPGPFTAVRAALVVANTFAWLKNIPVVGVIRKNILDPRSLPASVWGKQKKYSGPVRPWYGRQPNITKPSKRR